MTSRPSFSESMKKRLFLLLGLVFCGFGFLGAVLPLIPATPFLLLAAFFFSRSSERLHQWLLNNKVCGEYIRNYRDHRGMNTCNKVITVVTLWVSILLTAFVATDLLWLRILLITIAFGVSAYIMRLKNVPGPCTAPEQEGA